MFPDEDSYPSCDHTPSSLPGNKIAIRSIATDFGCSIVAGPPQSFAWRTDVKAQPCAEGASQKADNWQNVHQGLE